VLPTQLIKPSDNKVLRHHMIANVVNDDTAPVKSRTEKLTSIWRCRDGVTWLVALVVMVTWWGWEGCSDWHSCTVCCSTSPDITLQHRRTARTQQSLVTTITY